MSEVELDVIAYRVFHGKLTGAEGRIITSRDAGRALIRIRDHDRTETDEETVEALLKKAESGVDELGPLLAQELTG